MKRTTIAYLLVTILGALLAAVGLLSARVDALPLIVSKILAPLGATVFGVGLGGLFGQGLLQSDPVLRQREKERHDERNTAIRYRAEELEPVLREAISLNIPVVIDCQISCDDKVFPMVSPGAPIADAFDDTDLKIN